jgi:hypothetical protein
MHLTHTPRTCRRLEYWWLATMTVCCRCLENGLSWSTKSYLSLWVGNK